MVFTMLPVLWAGVAITRARPRHRQGPAGHGPRPGRRQDAREGAPPHRDGPRSLTAPAPRPEPRPSGDPAHAGRSAVLDTTETRCRPAPRRTPTAPVTSRTAPGPAASYGSTPPPPPRRRGLVRLDAARLGSSSSGSIPRRTAPLRRPTAPRTPAPTARRPPTPAATTGRQSPVRLRLPEEQPRRVVARPGARRDLHLRPVHRHPGDHRRPQGPRRRRRGPGEQPGPRDRRHRARLDRDDPQHHRRSSSSSCSSRPAR